MRVGRVSAAGLIAALACAPMLAAAPTPVAAAAPRYEITFVTGGRLSKRLPMAIVGYAITPGSGGAGRIRLRHRLLPEWTTTVGLGPFPSATLSRVNAVGRRSALCDFQDLRVAANAPAALELSYASKTGSC